MAITIPTYDEVEAAVLSFLRNRFAGKDSHSESFLGKHARGLSMTVLGWHQSAKAADADAVPTEKTSEDGLDTWADSIGLLADAAGNFGRKTADPATGGAGTVVGTAGTVYANGLLLYGPDGVTVFKLDGGVTTGGGGTVAGLFVAVTPGTAGNLQVGDALTWQSPPSGSASSVTLTTALSGGVDLEDGAALLERIRARMRQPPKGGTALEYRSWAESVDGVFRAYVYPNRGGTGSVHIVIVAAGSGAARVPGSGTRTATATYISGPTGHGGVRPVTVGEVTIFLPNTSAISIVTRVVPSLAQFAFDWASAGTPMTVASWNAGTLALTLTAPVPVSLRAAIALGAKPRLQIASPGAVIPTEVRVLSIDTTNSIVTLDAAPSVMPASPDKVYPGGPVVSIVAAAIQEYVDGLGPSKICGAADALDPWEDTAALARIGQIALDQLSGDGLRLCSNLVAASTLVNGAALDVRAQDDLLAQLSPLVYEAPEILTLSQVIVTD